MTVALAVAWLLLALGAAYVGIGAVMAVDMARFRERDRFGLAFIAIAATCGPHHLIVGEHALSGAYGGPLELVTIAAGLPPAVCWLWLRLEAFFGGRGDRVVNGGSTPLSRSIHAVPACWTVYMVALGAFAGLQWRTGHTTDPVAAAAVAVSAIYFAVGAQLRAEQRRRYIARRVLSLSGLSLSWVFNTCALMHLAFGYYVWNGLARTDWHIGIVHYASIPAGLWFLFEVWHLKSRGAGASA